ncbi:MAG: hypothetical protein PVJ39_07580 [Gammaproteobacteria bacterium]|jgi:hypothetical protein
MGNETVQKLAHDYAVGTISQYEYRKRRTALIDKITGYSEKAANHASAAPVPANDIDTAAGGGDNFKRYKLFVLVIVTIAIIMAALQHDNELQQSRTPSGDNQTLQHNLLSA